MTIPTTANVCWPSRLAYAAAFIFSLASAGTNLLYGIAKGTDLASSTVWGAVSVAVSIVFALSWPAFIRCCDAGRWARAVIVAMALLITGTFSVSAALGSAMGGRVNAESAETTSANDRKRAQAAYDKSEKELAKLSATRSVEELETLVATARPICRVHVISNARQTVCTKPPGLETELARAKQRAKLQAAMETASSDLKAMGAPKAANTDAAALALYLNGLWFDVTTDRINKLLVLLAVLVVECGGGLSLAIAMCFASDPANMSTTSNQPLDKRLSIGRLATGHARTRAANAKQILNSDASSACPVASRITEESEGDANALSLAGAQFLAFLKERGGVLVGGQREMAATLGWSKSWTNVVLHQLAGAGLVKLNIGTMGTVVRIASATSLLNAGKAVGNLLQCEQT